VYVTHDQREALALSDRIAVFNDGRIEQLDTAERLYREPNSQFAASFVGDANVFAIDVVSADGDAVITSDGLRLPVKSTGEVSGPHWLVVRPEDVRFDVGQQSVEATIMDAAFRGASITYRADCAALDSSVKAEIPDNLTASTIGAQVGVSWDAQRARLLPRGDS